MQTRKVVLKDFNVAAFKALIVRSYRVTENNINLTIRPENLESKSSYNSAFYKGWIAPATGLWTSENFDECYLSILNGQFFIKEVLGAFDNNCTVTLTVIEEDNHVDNIQIEGGGLKLLFKGSPLNFSFEKFEDGEREEYFDLSTAKSSFQLSGDNLTRIINLYKISKESDKESNYVQFEGSEDGKLIARDNSFELDLGAYTGDAFSAKFSKELLKRLDRDDHVFSLIKDDKSENPIDRMVMTAENIDIDLKVMALLMFDLDGDGGDWYTDGDESADIINFDADKDKGW